ncbi:hypothetical protein HYPSUDRAFT_1068332 [Hypholoma sublateritium FD-334 SS-4]|uniref:Major facilitator superfamily (MFS) profile domain-containing protein n=1 Tax=Hypholoma sublateritium (strain FD-334 SS-4) TaxID=945553 RepID=A0A0D2NFS8_HYPSF|nr:hypothetical protein HYPSUDRAFT_1068332 [Hypholoma sublateritium FD-334 SS-4]
MMDGETLHRNASEPNTIRSSKGISNEKEVAEPNILPVEDEEAALPNAPAVIFPEGGWRAWSTIAGAYIGSFGVYQAFYVRQYLRNFSTSDIGWIGGIQICLNFAPGIIAGRLFDRGYFIVLYALALFMLSISHEGSYYQVLLTNGVALGLACGLTYSPSLAIASHYFKQKRAIAVGIISSGSALGSVIHPIMLNRLINGPFGFHNAVRVSGAMNVSLLLIALALMRTRLPPKEKAESFPIRNWFREPAFLVIFLSAIPIFLGLFFAPFYIQLNAVTHGVDEHLAFYTVSILNAGSICGRIIPGAFVHTFGTLNLVTLFTIASGIVVTSMASVKNFASNAVVGILFGIFSGASIALTPAIIAQMADHPNEIGTRTGIYFGLGGFVGLFATPILGALLTSEYHWIRPILFSGVCFITPSTTLLLKELCTRLP